MKLNNRGWGLGVFLAFASMLLLCIAVAGVNAYKMGLSSDSPKHYFDSEISTTPKQPSSPKPNYSSDNYKILEEEVLEAVKKYINDIYSSLTGDTNLVISLQNLEEKNYLSSREDCSGYVQIQNLNQDTEYRVFLNCPNYITEGYSRELDTES